MRKMAILLGVVMLLASAGAAGAAEQQSGPPVSREGVRGQTPVQILFVDIEMNDIFLDKATKRVWVTWRNAGTVKIEKALREQVWVNNALVDNSVSNVLLEPGAYFSHQVGADPGVVINSSSMVKATIDVDGVLGESQERRFNNTKEVRLPKLMMNPEAIPHAIPKP